MRKTWLLVSLALLCAPAAAQRQPVADAFRPLADEAWPTPGPTRTGSGAPGPAYWQQRADFRIAATLNEADKTITAEGTLTYRNNAPEPLDYLWLLLDSNIDAKATAAQLTGTVTGAGGKASGVEATERRARWPGGYRRLTVSNAQGKPLPTRYQGTLLRVDLPQPLRPGESVELKLGWTVAIPETGVVGGRAGYDCADASGSSCIYLGGHWFPRPVAFSDYRGWHVDPFLGDGEFALEFGNYDVALTVPSNHIVSATGTLQNAPEVLTAAQQQRLEAAAAAREPVMIVSGQELTRSGSGTKTWRFRAENVRDFAFASSARYQWDAMGVDVGSGKSVLAMSFYPTDVAKLWQPYSTRSVAHALKTYSAALFPYPYPVAQVAYGPVDGMEYPMLVFNDPAPRSDGSIGTVDKAGPLNSLVGIHIHEIGHIWLSQIINSDERQWSWMDEGLNSYLQFRSEQAWDPQFLSRLGGPPQSVRHIMARPRQTPLMTHSDSMSDYFDHSYIKTATALNVLGEAVLGRETFDHALADYARRWAFKRPTPYDFFRTIEQSSGTKLDWFWRGWFYGVGHVDLALDAIREAKAQGGSGRYYHFDFRNAGGIVMPIWLQLNFADGSSEKLTIPASVWRRDNAAVRWQYRSDKPVTGARIDPDGITADIDPSNNGARTGAASKTPQDYP